MKVILIGYRATGKSTVGRLLSQKLNIPFFDTDQVVEGEAGMPIKELVTRYGWETFRKKETEAIASLGDGTLGVVATGGGAIVSAVNREMLKNMGTLIYLKTPLPDIIGRLNRDAENKQIRPQFTSGNLMAETIAALKDRLPLYEQAADFTMDTDGKNITRVTDDVYQYLLEAGFVSGIKKEK